MQFREDDVLVMTYPKCGTTWMQEIIWTMRNNPNLSKPSEAIFVKSPFVEWESMLGYMGPIMQPMQGATELSYWREVHGSHHAAEARCNRVILLTWGACAPINAKCNRGILLTSGAWVHSMQSTRELSYLRKVHGPLPCRVQQSYLIYVRCIPFHSLPFRVQ